MRLLKVYFIFISTFIFAQQGQWKGYFSYNDVKAMSPGVQDIRVAAQNAYFQYKPNTGETKKITPIDGLAGLEITAFHYSTTFNKTILGYGNGLLQVVNEGANEVLNRIDKIANNRCVYHSGFSTTVPHKKGVAE